MQRKREASEPCSKAESGIQTAHNKRVARLSATVPVVQIPDGFGTPQNANALWRCFWQWYPLNTQQNSTGIWTEKKPEKPTATHWKTFHYTDSASTSTGSDAAVKGSIWTLQQGRIRQPNHSQQTRCKTFSNYACGSDPNTHEQMKRQQKFLYLPEWFLWKRFILSYLPWPCCFWPADALHTRTSQFQM